VRRTLQRFLLVPALAALAAASMSACASKTSTKTGAPAPAATTAAPTATATGGAAGGCVYTKSGAPAAKPVGTPPATAPTTGAYTATLTTGQGAITIKLDAAKAPCTVNSFVYLAGKKYFDATTCHRLTTAGIFVLQCGDPTASGSGGPGYQFRDENLAGATYPAGTVAMANAGPGTNGSQFFLVYKNTSLPPSYTPFGTITAGLDVITKIAAAGSDESNGPGDGKPKLAADISQVTIATG
jgi:peptidyl-prolyl cis-trans isomerase B (cyclophilin B)